jgi:hypothetical protein
MFAGVSATPMLATTAPVVCKSTMEIACAAGIWKFNGAYMISATRLAAAIFLSDWFELDLGRSQSGLGYVFDDSDIENRNDPAASEQDPVRLDFDECLANPANVPTGHLADCMGCHKTAHGTTIGMVSNPVAERIG